MTDKKSNIVKLEGKSYLRRPDGSLAPIKTEAEYAAEQSDKITSDFTITGVRLSNAADPNADGVVVTFTRAEAAGLVKTVKDILDKRAKG